MVALAVVVDILAKRNSIMRHSCLFPKLGARETIFTAHNRSTKTKLQKKYVPPGPTHVFVPPPEEYGCSGGERGVAAQGHLRGGGEPAEGEPRKHHCT